MAIVILILLIIGIAAVYLIHPNDAPWMPKCLIHSLTGYECPTCGSTRAVHYFLHGEFSTALSYNPYMLFSIPFFIGVLLTTIYTGPTARKFKRFFQSTFMIWAYIISYIVWGIIRNLIN